MADILPSKSRTEVVDTSRKRNIEEAGTGDVEKDAERRKKRKRTPHSKKKPDEDSIKSQDAQLATSAGQSADGIGSSGSPLQEKEKENPSKEKNPSVKVDQSDSTETPVLNSSEATGKKSKEKKRKKEKKEKNPVPDKIDKDVDTKSEKKKDKYPDPSKDTELSVSALKALSYVYERLSSRSEWKFNKARQNWLLRNLWDTTIIPDLYFPSCVKYLKGVQGNSRNVLIKECNTILEEHSKTIAEESAKVAGTVRFQEPEGTKRPTDAKLLRAKMILAKLGDKPKG